MFTKVLIANRGAIACRVIRTLKAMGITAVSVYHQADSDSLHVQNADESYSLGDGSSAQTYLNQDLILSIATQHGIDAIHPGYGFLSENPDFAKRCEQAQITFLGPTAEQMIDFGLKHRARTLAKDAQVPLLPGSELLETFDQARIEAEQIGYPVMLKSTAGGGGIGMQRCNDSGALRLAFDSVKRLSANNFSNSGVFLEKFICQARHIEVQIFGDGLGEVIAIGERDCSAQRRNQKVIEECPAPGIDDTTRQSLYDTAIKLGQSINYRSAGTVEYVFDAKSGQFYFLEMNTRLQVEHGVTEQVYGIDLVRWMIELGQGNLAPLSQLAQPLRPHGHAIQARLYAEDPAKQFRPSAGLISHVGFPEQDRKTKRIDHWLEAGIDISALFDPMLAKLIACQPDRDTAIATLKEMLCDSEVYGIETNRHYLLQLLESDPLKQGTLRTNSLSQFSYISSTLDVLSGGTQTTIQDFPGRTGYWHIGVPPSGPMDNYSFRLGNQLLNNKPDTAGIEITLTGPTLHFNISRQIVLTGADIQASLDGQPLPMWQIIDIPAGSTLNLGQVDQIGSRSYLLLNGGIDCPEYLGSRSTFTLGQFGGHVGRTLQAGDVLHLPKQVSPVKWTSLATTSRPQLTNHWQINVIYGPHGAPDFFTPEDIETLFSHDYEVHYNSSRTGVRLIGPTPQWARADGGEAGLHPSNLHDNAYAVGTIDFTGDMPVILGPDGPSLGGFVCPATIIKADLWKMGQLKAGDTVHFIPVSMADAERAERAQLAHIETLQAHPVKLTPFHSDSAILKTITADQFGEQVVYRPSGEDYLLIEYGPQILDIRLRFRSHALMLWLEKAAIEGIHELTPGIRSLQIHYDNLILPVAQLLNILEQAESELTHIDSMKVPARVVRLPLSWDDEATRLAIQKYDQIVRKDAPWAPSNIEFIRRINGLDSIEQVKEILFSARYLVMGLGDVYLGAPVATPIDPRHRLVTTKYNPARTWTPENAVGIGGAYLCVYGMEGPGGYQFVGRTLQMWNRYHKTEAFEQPWLLRFFDIIEFYEVSADELKTIRREFPKGNYPIDIQETEFSLEQYNTLLQSHEADIHIAKQRQQIAFEAERQRWEETGQADFHSDSDQLIDDEQTLLTLPQGQQAVESFVSGSIWQVLVSPDETVKANQVVMVIESMKMEIEVLAPCDGTVISVCHEAGHPVRAGQPLLILEQ
ncbi:MAG: Carbamoyl-phosphate synthase large chain [Candidatus Celerinatantimonas neptuna]|nr:MAG: Carbamoyl-phosphate synthase large chain [Candidatus Celerinatantimonas neptuna]